MLRKKKFKGEKKLNFFCFLKFLSDFLLEKAKIDTQKDAGAE